MQHRECLIHVLPPNHVDLLSGRRIAALSIAAVRGAGEHPGNSFNQWAIRFGHACPPFSDTQPASALPGSFAAGNPAIFRAAWTSSTGSIAMIVLLCST